MFDLCKQHQHKQVLIHTHDGNQFIGMIEHVDEMNVYLIMPAESHDAGMHMQHQEQAMQRVWLGGLGYPGLGYPGVGYPGLGYPSIGYPGFGYPGIGYPGFGYPGYFYPGSGLGYYRRLVLPLAALTALSLLPY